MTTSTHQGRAIGGWAGGPEPFVSACLIVRDEAAVLAGCLASLAGLADEIVVYDTGSVDGSIEIARAAGAIVAEGYWDDDFARARNAALELCHGDWILHVDADETVAGDLRGLRADLQHTRADLLAVAIENVAGPTATVRHTHRAGRLFRRDRGLWTGRLHEQIVGRDGRELLAENTEHIRLVHTGYGDDQTAKSERNLRIARLQVDDEPTPAALLDVARSLVLADQVSEGLAVLSSLRRDGVGNPVLRRRVLRSGVECLLALGRPGEALEWIEELRSNSQTHGIVDYLSGSAHLVRGDAERAIEFLDRIAEARDDDGNELPADLLQVRRGLAYFKLGHWDRCVETLLPIAARASSAEPVWGAPVEAAQQRGAAREVAMAVTPETLVVALGQALTTPAEAADAFGEELWRMDLPRLPLASYGARLAPQLDLNRTLEWSARTRQEGASSHCPLLAVAASNGQDPERRVLAAAIVAGAFADETSLPDLERAAALVGASRFTALLTELDALAPVTLPTFVRGAASTPSRCRMLAESLAELGAVEQAEVLVDMAIELERVPER